MRKAFDPDNGPLANKVAQKTRREARQRLVTFQAHAVVGGHGFYALHGHALFPGVSRLPV